MHQGPACLTHEEYQIVRDAIDIWNLWWEDDEPPSRVSPALMMRGWQIVTRGDMAPLIGVAVNRGGRKRLSIREDAPLSVQATAVAHTLAHDLLGHPHEVDLILTSGARRLIGNRGVHPAHDDAAHAAAALLLIPDRYAHSGLSVREIASWCGVPSIVAARRLTGTHIVEGLPPGIIPINRRATTCIWSPDERVTTAR